MHEREPQHKRAENRFKKIIKRSVIYLIHNYTCRREQDQLKLNENKINTHFSYENQWKMKRKNAQPFIKSQQLQNKMEKRQIKNLRTFSVVWIIDRETSGVLH